MAKIIDCDRHVIEPIDMWAEYTEKKVFENTPVKLLLDSEEKRLNRIKNLKLDVSLPPIYTLGDSSILGNWGETEQIASALINGESKEERKKATNPVDQIVSMDEANIVTAKIFPTFAGYIANHKAIDAKTSLAYTKAYNRWLLDYCNYDSVRLNGVGLISRHDPVSLVSQVENVVKRGWSAITIRPEPILGKTLGDPSYEAFWQACEYHNLAIAFHGGTHLQGSSVGIDRFSSRFALHSCAHPMEAQLAFVSLLAAGVLERHPKLKFAFLEAGASWVPHWLWRLDNICYPEFPSLVKDNIKMLPSEYFKRQCWVAIEPGEPCLRQVIDVIGHEKLLYGSDYPHPDHLHLSAGDFTKQFTDLTETEIHCLLEHNAKSCFGTKELDIKKPTESELLEVTL